MLSIWSFSRLPWCATVTIYPGALLNTLPTMPMAMPATIGSNVCIKVVNFLSKNCSNCPKRWPSLILANLAGCVLTDTCLALGDSALFGMHTQKGLACRTRSLGIWVSQQYFRPRYKYQGAYCRLIKSLM